MTLNPDWITRQESVSKNKNKKVQTSTVTVEISVTFPWEAENRFATSSSYSTLGVSPQDSTSDYRERARPCSRLHGS